MKLRMILITAMVGLCFLSRAAGELPNLGSPEKALSRDEERKLGQIFIQSVRQQTTFLDDLIVADYFTHLGQKLAFYTHNPSQDWHFYVIDDKDINAFAGPDGYICLYTGLFKITDNENELAGVLAHEIMHVNQRHIMQSVQESQNSNLATVGMVLAALALSQKAGEVATAGAITAASAGNIQHMINYTRSFEQEADRLGMHLLYDAGFDPSGMLTFFNKLQQMTSSYGEDIPEILRTHPLTESRLADLTNRVKDYPHRDVPSSLYWQLAKARIVVETTDSAPQALSYFRSRLKAFHNQPADRYGEALALEKIGQLAESEQKLSQLITEYPKEVVYLLSLAELDIQQRNLLEALPLLQKAHEKFPHYMPATLLLADTMITLNKPQEALPLLRKQAKATPQDSSTLFLLAQAEGQSGYLLTGYQTQAHAFELLGYPQESIILLKQALQLNSLTEAEKTSLNQEIERLKKDMAE